MSRFSFHVGTEVRPSSLMELLTLLYEYPESDDELLLIEGANRGFGIGTTTNSARNLRDNIMKIPYEFGLIDLKNKKLTDNGEILYNLCNSNPSLFSELIHYFYYSTWKIIEPSEKCFSWTYATACRLLWEGHQSVITDHFVNTIRDEIHRTFPDQKGNESFGTKSVNGVLNWLRSLDPAVIEKTDSHERFKRRAFCSPELFVFAIDSAYKNNSIPYGSNLLLDTDIQTQICHLCLLDLEGFDRVAKYAVAQFTFLHAGLGGWGNYMRLERAPILSDLL
jgi:hypothetical protein